MVKGVTYTAVRLLCAVMAAALLAGCSAAKFVPDGRYMLDGVELVADTDAVDASRFEPYVRQRGNSKWLSLAKVPLGVYAMSGRDTTKWLNRRLQALGEAPVLLDTAQASLTCADLAAALRSEGYLRGTADYSLEYGRRKKVKVVYSLHPGRRYTIGGVGCDIADACIDSLLEAKGWRTALREGAPFETASLEAERTRLASLLNDNGYMNFHKDFVTFTADTVTGGSTVDLTLHLHNPVAPDGGEGAHRRYTVGSVSYSRAGGGGRVPLRRAVLEENTLVRPGGLYNASDLQETYNRFGRLPIVRYTNIRFSERGGSDTLDCDIAVSTNKINSISFQPEGTNTAGDLGAAASLTYENRNLFNGAESFSVKLRGAFEAITGLEGYQNQDYEEYSLEARLVFPRFLAPLVSRNFRRRQTAVSELSVSYNMQNRPEFHRRVFSAAWRYRWNDARGRRSYKLDLLDLNYIYMPWISDTFREGYLDDVDNINSILRYNYEDLFIMKLGFGMSYNGGNEAFKLNVETAGNLLGGISSAIGGRRNAEGQYTLFNIAFAQYVKGDFDYTRLFAIDRNNSLAFHFGFGIAYPYGNSKVLPFEKRYFSGGANSVRGWSVRGLGPGGFKGTNGAIDFINQTGDMKLDINLELRSFLFWKVYGALFVDAGNIWTLRAYEEQPGGQFRFKDFYKQIAVSYGLGIRFNFDFFILRFDMGMKAINPAYSTKEEHYALLHPDFSRDFAFHFAVGLPF